MDDVELDGGRSPRPPVRTEGVLRPEGGRRAASGDAPAPARQWPMLAVLAGVGLGLLVTLSSFRAGLLLVGGAVLAGGVLRAMVPNVGLLAVRSRFTDVVTLGVLGLGIVLLALMAMPRPILEMPWLTDALRFAVR
jgi:Protein of unknown function (DUF3017)